MTDDEINIAADAEGWGVFDSYGSVSGPLQIQRCDERDTFETDEDAWEHVWRRAQEGSAVHQAALDLVKAENPMEYRAIEHWVAHHEPLDQPPYDYEANR